MRAHGGASVVSGSSRTEGDGNENGAEENRTNETNPLCMKAVRPRLRIEDVAGEGRLNNVEQLERPALFGRKATRKTCAEDNRGMWREGNPESDEERPRPEHSGSRERGTQRKMETAESHEDGSQGTQGSGDSGILFMSDIQQTSLLDVQEISNDSQRQQVYPRPQGFEFIQTATSNLNSQSSQLALPSQWVSSRPLTRDSNHHSFNSSRNPDPFWAEVRTGATSRQSSQTNLSQTRVSAVTQSESEDEEDREEDNAEDVKEEGRGLVEVMGLSLTSAEMLPCVPVMERRMMKIDRSRIKSLRWRQRRRERRRQSQQQGSRQSSTGNQTSSSSEDEQAQGTAEGEGFICAVCLDVYFCPYMCHPCNHIFCEPCLRTLAKNGPTNTPCPLCRTIITHVFFQKELNQTTKTFFPKEYLSRKQNFQRAPCAKWPLPSCRKLFRIFEGFQRQTSPGARHQFPHAGGYPLDNLDFEDNSRGWRFDMDMVIIYIYSVNWLIGFFIFCFLCYVFFPSF